MTDAHRLGELERRLLDFLIAGDHATLKGLRQQARVATVKARRVLEMGLELELHVPRSVHPVVPEGFTLSDVTYHLKGAADPGQPVLFVQDGFISRISILNWTDPWPAEPAIESLHYLKKGAAGGNDQPTDTRDLGEIARELAV